LSRRKREKPRGPPDRRVRAKMTIAALRLGVEDQPLLPAEPKPLIDGIGAESVGEQVAAMATLGHREGQSATRSKDLCNGLSLRRRPGDPDGKRRQEVGTERDCDREVPTSDDTDQGQKFLRGPKSTTQVDRNQIFG
jgi:hypothetical protein